MNIHNMKINHQKNPIGIDSNDLCFSWNIETKEHNWIQKSYRILVALGEGDILSGNNIIWDSEWVESSCMINIPYCGKELQSDTRYYWQVLVTSPSNSNIITSKIEYFETALMDGEEWQGDWIGEIEDHSYHIYRKEFKADKEVKRAKLYVCGLGHYEFYMNGERVGDYVLEPGWTNYNKSNIYSSYDVTSQIKIGKNAMGSFLGDGMYNVPGGRYVYYTRSFGKPRLLVQLHITYVDETKATITTDPTWRMAPSPIGFSCIYGGEDYDSCLEQYGYSLPEFIEDDSWVKVNILEESRAKLVSRNIPPVKVMKIYEPVSVKEIKPGVYLYDLGTNFSGWARVKISTDSTMKGKIITMTPGEILSDNMEPDQKVTGRGYHWQYTLNDECNHNYAPKFTYTGFRYVKVEGAIPREMIGLTKDGEESMEYQDKMPIIESLLGEFIYTDVELGGEFRCSNELFNSIHKIINQAMLSNLKSILTDCPHREKLGWLEQTHLIGPALMYNYNVHSLYHKICQDMKESQRDSGLIPDISPEYITFGYHDGFTDSPEWGSAIIISPWYIYRHFKDVTILEKYYDVMKKYLNYLTSKTHHHVLHHGLGDWLDIGPNTPYSQNTPVPVIATTIYYYDISIMKEIAHILGRVEDELYFEELGKCVYEEYNMQFFDDQTYRYATGSQAAQAMSLVCGLVEDKNKEKVMNYLVKDIKARDYATTAGDIGHPFVMTALTMFGRSDVINTMTNITDKPGYGYQIACGATTLTEEWDGPDKNRPHGSQNHFMLGSVEEWFYSGLAGIQSVRNQNDINTVTIKPHFAEGISNVSAWTMHPHGKVSIEWKRVDKHIVIDLIVPANTKAVFVNEIDNSQLEYGSGKYQLLIDLKE